MSSIFQNKYLKIKLLWSKLIPDHFSSNNTFNFDKIQKNNCFPALESEKKQADYRGDSKFEKREQYKRQSKIAQQTKKMKL